MTAHKIDLSRFVSLSFVTSVLLLIQITQVYLLTIIPPSCDGMRHDDDLNFNSTSFVWTRVLTTSDVAALGELVPGRCHSASLVGKEKILIFGGSANPVSCNAVVVMDLSGLDADYCEKKDRKAEKDFGDDVLGISSDDGAAETVELAGRGVNYVEEGVNSVCLFAPQLFGHAPTERLSSLCAQVGKYFLIQGGYEPGRGCLSDCLVSDMRDETSMSTNHVIYVHKQ